MLYKPVSISQVEYNNVCVCITVMTQIGNKISITRSLITAWGGKKCFDEFLCIALVKLFFPRCISCI